MRTESHPTYKHSRSTRVHICFVQDEDKSSNLVLTDVDPILGKQVQYLGAGKYVRKRQKSDVKSCHIYDFINFTNWAGQAVHKIWLTTITNHVSGFLQKVMSATIKMQWAQLIQLGTDEALSTLQSNSERWVQQGPVCHIQEVPCHRAVMW